MAIEVLRCPNCAAPLPAGARGEVVCEYCRHVLTGVPTPTGYRWIAGDERPPDDGLPRVHVDGRSFAVMGRLAQGDGSDVFLARRDKRVTELVVLKALRAESDADLLANEWKTVEALQASEAQGWEFFRRMVPQPVAHGRMTRDGAAPGTASVFRWRSGFVHTFEDVLRAYPQGVPATAAVWLWKRALETLGWVHLSGYVHGAVLPAHLTLHARHRPREGLARVGRLEPHDAAVLQVVLARHHATLDKLVHNLRHGRRAHAQGLREHPAVGCAFGGNHVQGPRLSHRQVHVEPGPRAVVGQPLQAAAKAREPAREFHR